MSEKKEQPRRKQFVSKPLTFYDEELTVLEQFLTQIGHEPFKQAVLRLMRKEVEHGTPREGRV